MHCIFQFLTLLIASFCLDLDTPIMNITGNSIVLNETDRLVVGCKSTANPIARYQWRQAAPKIISYSSVLTIESISRRNSSSYVCTASNDVGEKSANFELTVHCKWNVIFKVLVLWNKANGWEFAWRSLGDVGVKSLEPANPTRKARGSESSTVHLKALSVRKATGNRLAKVRFSDKNSETLISATLGTIPCR